MTIRALLFFCLCTLCSPPLWGQELLDQYIQEALAGNIALQRKDLSYQKSLAALMEAKKQFLPQLSLEARFSFARGGRTFEIPSGDLVNPAYQNLNIVNQFGSQLSQDYPSIPTYPTIPNQAVNFLRETEQETVVRVLMPVYNNAIINNQKIKNQLLEADRIGVETYKRELVKEVKIAYYNYLKAEEAYKLYENTLNLITENLRTTQSLFKNHKVTKDAVYLVEAQLAEGEQQLAEADKNRKVAASYFNFLLNRDYNTAIDIQPTTANFYDVKSVESSRSLALLNREEFAQIDAFMTATDANVQLNKGNMLPNINLVADYGVQGVDYNIDRDADFFLGSLVMSWKLFQASNKYKTQQVQIEKMDLMKQKEAARAQIGLEVVQAWYEVEAAQKSIEQARASLKATQEAFKLVNKKYAQGQTNLVSWTDALTRLTNAGNMQIIALYEYLNKVASLERATAGYQFKNGS